MFQEGICNKGQRNTGYTSQKYVGCIFMSHLLQKNSETVKTPPKGLRKICRFISAVLKP